mgnify:CR=1 FL=1
MKKADCVIIGGGPAGLSAAAVLTRLGVDVVILDENPQLGGQYYRSPMAPARHTAPFLSYLEQGRSALVEAIDPAHVEVISGAQVYALTPERIVSYFTLGGSSVQHIEAKTVLIATGAYEAVNPFPGWTLPGVITLGGAQNMLKTQGMVPGERLVTAGSGPFLWLVSQQMIRAGAKVLAVAEAAPLSRSLVFARHAMRAPVMAMQGAEYWVRILASGAKFRMGWGVVKAEGSQQVERVTIAPYLAGKLDTQRARTFETDALCVSNTLVPSTQITQDIGCAGTLDPVSGAMLPNVSRLMETSVSGVFAAGETVGLGGEPKARLDGFVAGHGIAVHLGKLAQNEALSLTRVKHRAAAGRRKLTKAMFAAYAPPPLDRTMMEETLVCRCEEISGKVVNAAIAGGDRNTDIIKSRTRTGMGHCQGRMCGRTVQALVGQANGGGLAAGFTPRTPYKPVPINALLAPKND